MPYDICICKIKNNKYILKIFEGILFNGVNIVV